MKPKRDTSCDATPAEMMIVRASGRYERPDLSGEGRENNWLLTKRRDEHADPSRDPVRDEPESVVSGLTIEQVAGRG